MLGRRHGDHTRGSLAVAVVTVFRVLSATPPHPRSSRCAGEMDALPQPPGACYPFWPRGNRCLPPRVTASTPIHAAADALVKWTRSLSLREPVSPSGPGAIAVFLLGSQRARRCQIGPVLGHGDLAVSVVFWFSVYSG